MRDDIIKQCRLHVNDEKEEGKKKEILTVPKSLARFIYVQYIRNTFNSFNDANVHLLKECYFLNIDRLLLKLFNGARIS